MAALRWRGGGAAGVGGVPVLILLSQSLFGGAAARRMVKIQ